MEKIKIITDSTADLPLEIIKEFDIEVLPLLVSFGDEQYLDGVDIKLPEFLDKMKNSDVFPATSQINPQRFYDCFKNYLKQDYKILSIHLSSKMSGTYQSACIAKEMLDTEDIIVIDSLNVTSGLGLLVYKACLLKKLGMNLNDISREIEKAKPHVKSALAFESLDNLVKGGRLSKAAGIIGNVLGIKLILEVKDGEMSVMDKVRGTKKAIRTILDYAEEKGMKKDETCIVLNAENDEILEILRQNMLERKQEFLECEVGCVVGTHSGSGASGIFFIEDY